MYFKIKNKSRMVLTRVLITHCILHRALTLTLQLEVETTAQLQPWTLICFRSSPQHCDLVPPRLCINKHIKVICSLHCFSVWHDNHWGTSFNYLQTYVVTEARGRYSAIIFSACASLRSWSRRGEKERAWLRLFTCNCLRVGVHCVFQCVD